MEKDRKLVNDKDRKSIIEIDRKSDCSVCGFSAEGIKQLKTHLLLKHPGMKVFVFYCFFVNCSESIDEDLQYIELPQYCKAGFPTFFILCPPKPKIKSCVPPSVQKPGSNLVKIYRTIEPLRD